MFNSTRNIQEINDDIDTVKRKIRNLEIKIHNITDAKGFENVKFVYGDDMYNDVIYLTAERVTKGFGLVKTGEVQYELRENGMLNTKYVVKEEHAALVEEIRKLFVTAKEREEEKLEELRKELKSAANKI